MSVKVTFLGTGTSQGVPVIACDCPVCTSSDQRDKRLRSSVYIETGDLRLVIDTGPDFRQQMLNINAKNLDAVVFTHEHKDHIAGLDDVRAFNYAQGKAMEVYAASAVEVALRREFHYVFSDDNYPGIPKLNLNQIDNNAFEINGVVITPIQVYHYKMPVFGFRIGDFSYITDAKTIDEDEKNKIRGSEVLVLNALRNHQHISHFTLQEAIELANELEVEQTYFTHISHYLGLHEQVSEKLPTNMALAHDGLVIEV
ncbi:MAG: MBL fold metallo-hydrolase [Vicingaceae bacterium]